MYHLGPTPGVMCHLGPTPGDVPRGAHPGAVPRMCKTSSRRNEPWRRTEAMECHVVKDPTQLPAEHVQWKPRRSNSISRGQGDVVVLGPTAGSWSSISRCPGPWAQPRAPNPVYQSYTGLQPCLSRLRCGHFRTHLLLEASSSVIKKNYDAEEPHKSKQQKGGGGGSQNSFCRVSGS